MTIYSWKDFHWDRSDLRFKDRTVAYLIPHKDIENHYHIRFEWRDEPTLEFFNLSNAKDNARSICLAKANNNTKKHAVEAH